MSPIDRMSIQEFEVLMASRRQTAIEDANDPDPGPESELQSKIKAHCKQQGWPCLSFPQTRYVDRLQVAGWPDMTIIMPHTVLFMELKAKKGRFSAEQRLMNNMFRHLGHIIYEVRSFKKFLEITTGILRRE